jgi:Putative intracellular protease/amidase
VINDKKIAILAEDGVDQRQLAGIREALEKNGIKTEVLAPRKREVKGWTGENWGIRFRIQSTIDAAKPEDFDGVVIPGGAIHADHLREDEQSRNFIRQLFAAGKIVGALGHGVQVLIDADVIRGRKVTATSSVSTDLKNAGALIEDHDVAADNGLLTSRDERTMEAFTTELIDVLRKGLRQRTEAVI